MSSLKLTKIFIVALAFFVLVMVSGFRILGEDADYQHYLNLFNYGYHAQGDTKELSFVFFRYMINNIFHAGFHWLLFAYAIIGVGIKLYAIGRLSVNYGYSIFVYLMVYYPLHEYTQIRAGVAAGIFLIALPDILKGYRLGFLLKIFLAALFHWSALVALPLFFFRGRQLYSFFVAVVFALVAIPFKVEIVSFVSYILSLSELLSSYYSIHSGHTESFRVVNVVFLLNLIIMLCSFWLVLRGKISARVDNLPSLLVAIHLFSMIIYLSFSVLDRPVISFRLSEFFSVVMLLMIPLLSKLSGGSLFVKLAVFLVPVVYFWHLVFRVNIFPSI